MEKTGISEVAVITAALSFLEPALNYVTGSTLIPDPFDKLAIGALAVVIWFLRRRQKQKTA